MMKKIMTSIILAISLFLPSLISIHGLNQGMILFGQEPGMIPDGGNADPEISPVNPGDDDLPPVPDEGDQENSGSYPGPEGNEDYPED